MTSVVIKSIDRAQVHECVDEYARELLATCPEVEEIVVFGSFEKGNYAPGSDVDIFILLSSSDRSVRDRIPQLLPDTFPVGVGLFPYTREEVTALEPSSLLDTVRESRWRYQR